MLCTPCIFSACALAPSVSDTGDNQKAVELYTKIKAVVHDFVEGDIEPRPGLDPGLSYQPPVHQIAICDDAEQLGFPADSPLFTAVSIALQIEFHKKLLARLRIPLAVAAPSFSAMEKLAASTISTKKGFDLVASKTYRRLGERLAGDLNDYARQHRPGMLRFQYWPECGDGRMSVLITTTPPGATVSYIPLFCYKLCEARGVDPEDSRKCEGWLTAVSDLKEDLIGTYKYKAVWPDGKRTTTRELSVESDKTINIRYHP